MANEVIMPKLGLTMEEGTITQWLKKEGDLVTSGEPLFEIETDKVVLEVNAMDSGVLLKIVAEEGETIPVAGLVAYLGEPGEVIEHVPEPKPQEIEAPVTEPMDKTAKVPARQDAEQDKKVKISGLAKRMAKEHNVDISKVSGSGPGGRIIEDDIKKYLESGAAPSGTGDVFSDVPYETFEPGRIKQVTAQRMSESFSSVPHFYLHKEINMKKLVEYFEKIKPIYMKDAGVELTYTDLLLRALAITLPEHPLLNASWNNGKIMMYKDVNAGLAIATEQGLVVGTLYNLNTLDLATAAGARKAIVERAKGGSLSIEDMSNSTITLTNLGMFGIDDFLPIINPPQSAILAVGAIANRPVEEEGRLALNPTMRLTLAVDHRVADGVEAALFLRALSDCLQQPELIN